MCGPPRADRVATAHGRRGHIVSVRFALRGLMADGRISRRAFVLGAGFSRHAGLPLLINLRQLVLDDVANNPPSWHRKLVESGEFLRTIEKADQGRNFGFEELFRELLLTEKHSVVACLRQSVRRVLRAAEPKELPSEYGQFGRRVFHNDSPIISFNWDTVAERAVASQTAYWEYGAPETVVLPDGISRPPSSWIRVVKPHGSINWMRARLAGLQPVAREAQIAYDANSPLTDPDRTEVHPDLRVMIFPGDAETPDDNLLSPLWQDAEAVASRAERIVLIGYSLPPYDPEARAFLGRICHGREVEVVNRNVDHIERIEEALGRPVLRTEKFFQECHYTSTEGDSVSWLE